MLKLKKHYGIKLVNNSRKVFFSLLVWCSVSYTDTTCTTEHFINDIVLTVILRAHKSNIIRYQSRVAIYPVLKGSGLKRDI